MLHGYLLNLVEIEKASIKQFYSFLKLYNSIYERQ
jgi:hypothetical protein